MRIFKHPALYLVLLFQAPLRFHPYKSPEARSDIDLVMVKRKVRERFTMKRLIAAFAAALMLAVGVPGVASANGSNFTEEDDAILLAVGCPNNLVEWPENSIFMEYGGDDSIYETLFGVSIDGSTPFVAGTVMENFFDALWMAMGESPSTISIIQGGNFALWDVFGPEFDYYAEFFTEVSVSNGTYSHPALFVETNTLLVALDQTEIVDGNCGELAIDPLTTSTPTLKRNGISFTPDNFDPTCAYEITTSAGTVKQNPVTGEVNVYGVGSGTSVSVTITDCTGATTTVSGKATAATAAVQTLTKPTVTTTADAITCSAGTSTVNPSSIAYTLLVDGVAVSTRFSDGAIAPSLVATTAAQNLYTGATLSKASWSIDPAWAGKSYSCTTTSYAAGAVGIANS